MHGLIKQQEKAPTLMVIRVEAYLRVVSDPKIPFFKGLLFIATRLQWYLQLPATLKYSNEYLYMPRGNHSLNSDPQWVCKTPKRPDIFQVGGQLRQGQRRQNKQGIRVTSAHGKPLMKYLFQRPSCDFLLELQKRTGFI